MSKKSSFKHKKNQTVAKKALNEVNKLKKLINIEYFYHNIISTALTPDSAGIITHISGIPAGDEVGARTGQKIHWVSLSVKMCMSINGVRANEFIRVMVVQDRQPNGAQFTALNLLENTGDNVSILSHRATGNMKRFKVYYDKLIPLMSSSNTSAVIDIYKRLNVNQMFSGNGGGIGATRTNALFFVLFSELSADLPLVFFETRLTYTDV